MRNTSNLITPCIFTLLCACTPLPGETGETLSGTETDADAGTTAMTDATASTGPTSEPTTTDAASTEASSESTTDAGTTDEGTTDGPPAAGCERVAGDGDVEWAVRCGGPADEWVNGVAVDAAGGIYVGLDLSSRAPGVPIQFGAFEVVPGERSDILIVKLDPAGEVVWVEHITGPEDQYLSGLWGCGDGVVIAGEAPAGTLDLGGGALAEADFIAALDGDGAHRWSRGVPILVEDGHLTVSEITCDAGGDAALTGQYRGGVDLGGGPIQAAGLYDGIVARYDPAGELLWSRGFGSVDGFYPAGRAVAFTPAGEVAVIGSFDGTIDLGTGPLTATAGDDVVVALFAADGTPMWSGQIGPDGLQYGAAIAVDAAGQIAIGGTFLDEITLADDSYVNAFPEAEEEIDGTLYDGFLAFLDAAGAPSSSLQIGTKLDDDVYQLEFDADGALMLTGFTAEAFTVRAHVDGVPGWQWTTEQFVRARTALTDGAVVVAASSSAAIDLGGTLAPHGGGDMLVAKIRR
jgi:hypothetical protein